MHIVPPIATILFLLIVGVLIGQVYRWQRILQAPRWITPAVVGWLALTAGVALSGFFEDFSTLPPRVILAVLPPFLTALWLTWKAPVTLYQAPPRAFVTYQGFRVVMEIVLFILFYVGVLPRQMSYEGRNFDILVGLTAPIMALLFLRRGKEQRTVMIAWNILSIGLLANIMIIGLLSAPTPFRVFTEGPANRVVALWPWIWLPSFVVPMALMGHLFSLRQLFAMQPSKKHSPVATA